MNGTVLSTNLNPKHGFSKHPQLSIHLLEGRGVEGDAHCGQTVQHLYLKRKNPTAANRMQVHLIQSELLDEVGVAPGGLGENITTNGVDLIGLPVCTRLHLGATAVVELTGLRTPCSQIESFRNGLLKQMVNTVADGTKSARAGVMAIVVTGGDVLPGDAIRVMLPPEPHRAMIMI